MRAARSSSSVTTMPPSPIGRFLFEKKLKQPTVRASRMPARRERRPDRVRGVLDHGDAVALGDLRDGGHVTGEAAVVEDDDGLRLRG